MSKTTKFPETISGLSPDEAEKAYQRLLKSRNSIKSQNDEVTKWASRVGNACTILATEGSLAFQAMAEKAGVRNHPSVSQAVAAFSALTHPQWPTNEEPVFPDDWNLVGANNEGAGDADMELNSTLQEVFRETPPWGGPNLTIDHVRAFFVAARGALREMQRKVGFKPRRVAVSENDLSNIGWVALDIAQQMNFARCMLRRDLRAAAYRQIEEDLYALAFPREQDGADRQFDIVVFGDVEAA